MKLRALVLLLLLSASVQAKVIIWDLGGVLFKPNKFGLGRSVGLSHFFFRFLFDWKSPNIQPILFDVLDMIECPKVPDDIHACTEKGFPLPSIMCHWQLGTFTGQEIIDRAVPHIDQLYQAGYFRSRREKSLVKKTICTMFNPEILARHMEPIRKGLDLLYECSHAKNRDGSPRNISIALSNWDTLSFDLLHTDYPEVFNHFNHLAISGKIGYIKPHKNAYEYLIKEYHLTPEECLFIDDQEINLETADELGFNTFHLHNKNYNELRTVLKEFKALV